MMTAQVTGMLTELPRNTQTIKAKIKSLRTFGSTTQAAQFERMVEEIREELDPQTTESKSDSSATEGPDSPAQGTPDSPVVVREEPMPWELVTGYLGSAFEALGALAFTLVLLVFFLLDREDLRDRMVLLAGKARLSVTSRALEDATARIGRYLVMVALVNGGFGLLLALGLFLLGMPYAFLWGFLAGTLRFIPYIGPWVGAVFPITMSLAVSNGWWQPLAVFGYVMVLELISNNVVEPLLFGRTTGVSPTALIVSAAFWLYLWGPIGLVLSAPFAVCMVVLGKNIPQLSFLYLLLGDQPALAADESYYQRLMLGEAHEATQLALKRLQQAPANDVYDKLLIPALNYAQRDHERDCLSDEDYESVLTKLSDSMDELVQPETRPEESAETVPNAAPPPTILGCPASDASDSLALEMLKRLLPPNRWRLEVVDGESLIAEVVGRIAADPPAIICIASIPAGGRAHARYWCKRLRAQCPEIPILVARLGQNPRRRQLDKEQLDEAGATFVTATLEETCRVLETRWPLVQSQPALTLAAQRTAG
ncbi:MAG TPA: AI-2E family transporter, partial [Planctomycetaceae bacterium]|nr:AI-2E family transporter [Planctomycetaceae bacterium]